MYFKCIKLTITFVCVFFFLLLPQSSRYTVKKLYSLYAVVLRFSFTKKLSGPNLLQHDRCPVHNAGSIKTWIVRVEEIV